MEECGDYMTVETNIGLVGDKYTISDEQAQAILDMKLNKLTNLEQHTILEDYNNAISSIKEYLSILSNPD